MGERTEGWSVRPATPADRGAVEAILAAAYPALLRGHDAPAVPEAALPIMTRAAPAPLASGRLHVAVDADGAACACGGWSEARPGAAGREARRAEAGRVEQGRGHVRHFATRPDACRRSLGRAVFGACAAQAEAVGIVELLVEPGRDPVLRGPRVSGEASITVTLAGAVPFPARIMTRSRAAL